MPRDLKNTWRTNEIQKCKDLETIIMENNELTKDIKAKNAFL